MGYLKGKGQFWGCPAHAKALGVLLQRMQKWLNRSRCHLGG